MGRLSLQLSSLIDPAPKQVISLEDADFFQSLENHLIVLEGLEVVADQMGTYVAGGQDTDAVTAKELKGEIAKWGHAASAISEGQNDLRSADPSDSMSWESYGLEDIDSPDHAKADAARKNVFQKIWAYIVKISKAVWSFIWDFITGSDAVSVKIHTASRHMEQWVKECRGKTPSVEHVPMTREEMYYFMLDNHAPNTPDDIKAVLSRTETNLASLLDIYTKQVGNSAEDVKKCLVAAFEDNFSNRDKNKDLLRAFSVFNPGEMAKHVGSARLILSEDGELLYQGSLLMDSRCLEYISFDFDRSWVLYSPHDAPPSKFLNAVRRQAKASVHLIKKPSNTPSEVHLPTMSLDVIEHLISYAQQAIRELADTKERMHKLEETYRQLDAVYTKCIKEADEHPEEYSIICGNILTTLASTNMKRVVGPTVELHKLVLQGAKLMLKLCSAHLKVYK